MPMRGKRKSSTLAEAPAAAADDLATIAPRPSKRRAGPRNSNPAVPGPEPVQAIENDAKIIANNPKAKPRAPRKGISKDEGASNGVAAAGPATGEKQPSGTIEDVSKTVDEAGDPETEVVGPAVEEEVKEALSRPPPVNSDYLPLPWKGRLGYACLNTYLRSANPQVFSSRTCRIQSILDHRHPLRNPNEPEHATKNRPDKTKPAEKWRGQKYVEELGLANARDISKMVRWNDRYSITFMRLSSEMFPFASHEEYGYKLAPFASETLAEAGRVAGKLGHRLTTHPGQFTQLGSPRKVVVDNSIRDLEYHAELLSLLKLPPQQDRDAVMILHMGGTFGSKEETLDRFRKNYAAVSEGVKKRLVLENDDVCWSVHDLLPICEELNIPFVLDFHHHNIYFDAAQIREGTKDIMELFPRILATWKRKGITPKMHYSEPTSAAITPRQRRKHSPRVATLPPCPPNMDLMIEAKDKEQAVFELMRTFKLPGYEKFNNIVPFTREDETRMAKPYTKKELKDRAAAEARGEALTERQDYVVPEAEVGMGGPLGRVYWPPGMEEWLRPEKVVKDKTPKKTANGVAEVKDEEASLAPTKAEVPVKSATPRKTPTKATPAKAKPAKATPVEVVESEHESEMSEEVSDELSDLSVDGSSEDESPPPRASKRGVKAAAPRPKRGRARVSYVEAGDSE